MISESGYYRRQRVVSGNLKNGALTPPIDSRLDEHYLKNWLSTVSDGIRIIRKYDKGLNN